MSNIKTIQRRIKLVKENLHFEEAMSRSRIAHLTGLHYFVIEDILNYLVNEGIAIEEDKKFRLIKKEENGGGQ